ARCIADRLLRDPIEVRRGREPVQAAREVARELDRNAIERLAARAELLERGREAVAIEMHGRQPERESAYGRNALLDQVSHGVHAHRELRRIARDRVLDGLEQQRDARELLAKAVVQIVADPLVLALAHLPDLGLEPPDLAHEALRDERHLARSRELALQLVLSLDRLGDVLNSTPVGERAAVRRARDHASTSDDPTHSAACRANPILAVVLVRLAVELRAQLALHARSVARVLEARELRPRRRPMGSVEPEQLRKLTAHDDSVRADVPVDQSEVAATQHEVEPRVLGDDLAGSRALGARDGAFDGGRDLGRDLEHEPAGRGTRCFESPRYHVESARMPRRIDQRDVANDEWLSLCSAQESGKSIVGQTDLIGRAADERAV